MTYGMRLMMERDAITALLARAGVSESELARASGVSRPHVCNVLNGKRALTVRVADKLLGALRGVGSG